MKRVGKTIGCSLLAILALLAALLSPWGLYFVLQIAPSWFPGPRPAGFPPDAVSTYEFKVGTRWQFCRNLPSGKAIHTHRGLLVIDGGRCDGRTVAHRDNPTPDAFRPHFWVFDDGHLSWFLPGDAAATEGRSCEQRLNRDFLARTRRLIDEAQALPEIAALDDPELTAARRALAKGVATPSVGAGDAMVCDLALAQGMN